MSRPQMVILSSKEAYERVGRLMTTMVEAPSSEGPIGRAIVDLMPMADSLTPDRVADAVEPFLRNHVLKDNDDPYFDQRILIEMITYGAKAFKMAWDRQTPNALYCGDYRFEKFLNGDLVLRSR